MTLNIFGVELTNYQVLIFIAGSLGLIVALYSVFRRQKKSSKINLGIRQATKKDDSWWHALVKTRGRFIFNSTEVEEIKNSFEEAFITSDLGVDNTEEIISSIDWVGLRNLNPDQRLGKVKEILLTKLEPWLSGAEKTLNWPKKSEQSPCVIWFVGVNGVGKTTSIAKLASELKNQGHSVLLAAADTFRAAAGEQLEEWAKRLEIPCVRGQAGADSSAVLFDAIQSGIAKKIDFVLCDSAGRLHNQSQLMEALQKNRRVMDKALSGAPHEVLLVLDANTGQNMLIQAEQFLDKVGVTGLVLSKLDGSARGGAVVAVARKTQLPILRIGLGEKAEDFVPFNSREFGRALLGPES